MSRKGVKHGDGKYVAKGAEKFIPFYLQGSRDSNSRTQAVAVAYKMVFVNEGKLVLRYALLSALRERGETAMNISAHGAKVGG